jgi:hypothetical protein
MINPKTMSVRKAAKNLVKAWESLPGNVHYKPGQVQKWLMEDMKPAIDELREALKKPTKPKKSGGEYPYTSTKMDDHEPVIKHFRDEGPEFDGIKHFQD